MKALGTKKYFQIIHTKIHGLNMHRSATYNRKYVKYSKLAMKAFNHFWKWSLLIVGFGSVKKRLICFPFFRHACIPNTIKQKWSLRNIICGSEIEHRFLKITVSPDVLHQHVYLRMQGNPANVFTVTTFLKFYICSETVKYIFFNKPKGV